MLKILWKRGEIAPEEQFLLLSTIFYYLILDFYVKTRIRFSLRDKRFFEISEVEVTRVDCTMYKKPSSINYQFEILYTEGLYTAWSNFVLQFLKHFTAHKVKKVLIL